MLLTETITNCTSAIQRRRTAQERKQSAEAYANALSKLNVVNNNLRSMLNCVSALKEKGIVDQTLMAEQTKMDLLECVNNCGMGLFDGSLTSDTVTILKTQSEAFSSQLQNKWKEASRKYAEGTRGYLSMIGGLSSDPKKAAELSEKIGKLTEGMLSELAITSLVENVTQAKVITDSFSLNGNIETFLKKVSSRQASIADLTPEVQKWLLEKHLSGKLKIVF